VHFGVAKLGDQQRFHESSGVVEREHAQKHDHVAVDPYHVLNWRFFISLDWHRLQHVQQRLNQRIVLREQHKQHDRRIVQRAQKIEPRPPALPDL
jgi:hypothetical protein